MSYQSKYTGAEIDASVDTTQQILNMIYPVGSIYMSVNNVSPATFIGGTWTALTDRVLIGAGSSYAVNATGGATSHTHTSAAHTHTSATHNHALSDKGWGLFSSSGNTVGWVYSGNSGYWNANWQFNVTSAANSSKEFRDGMVLGGVTETTTPDNTGSTTPGNTGSSSNLPPYLAVYMWKRTA